MSHYVVCRGLFAVFYFVIDFCLLVSFNIYIYIMYVVVVVAVEMEIVDGGVNGEVVCYCLALLFIGVKELCFVIVDI